MHDGTTTGGDRSGGAAERPAGFSLLSVVLPCYRLGPKIEANLARCAASLRAQGIPFELVPVDDGSGDGSDAAMARAAASLAAEGAAVRPVVLPRNGGKGAALVAGFRECRGSHVLLLDGDLELSPDDTGDFLRRMAKTGADVVIGSKMHPESRIDYPWRRRVASRVYYGLVKLLVGLPVHDTQTGMKLFTRKALGHAFDRMVTKRFAFDLEVLAILRDAGYRVAEAPIELDFTGKAGSLTLRNVRDVLVDTAAIFYRTRILGYYRSLDLRPMPSPPPSVTAVVACPAGSAMLRQCVDALADQRATCPSLEAIVLPDAPTGEAWPDWVREIPTGKVLPSEKRNAGIRAARGEIVAFLDDDARPLPGWLEHALPHFSDPAVGAVGGPAVTPPEDPFAAKMSGRVYESPLVSGGARRRYIPTAVQDEDDLPSCNLLVRAALLREIGGFKSENWPGEDTVLCLEIVHRRGRRMVYDPAAVAAHHRRPLFGPHLRQVSRYARHRGHFAKKFPETSRRLAYFVPSALLAGTAGTLACALLAPLARAFGALAAAGGGVLALYALAVLAASFSRNLRTWTWTAGGIAATHYAYGWNFLRGLFARSMPDGVRAFDHQG
ncbi:MAG: glycosyltransferase [Kiritimatiellae bacterium]|nr:glycosyltransferase [Kiritimatiellia bacterium]